MLGEVDPNGNITSSRKYDVYGLGRGGNNPAGTSSHKFVGQLGHPSEDNTGLIYMQARYYDPMIGRFASQDPGRHGINNFIYCTDDPVNRRDANGRIDWPTALAGGVIAFILFVLYSGANLFTEKVLEATAFKSLGALLVKAGEMLVKSAGVEEASGVAQIEAGAQEGIAGSAIDPITAQTAGRIDQLEGALTTQSATAKFALGLQLIIGQYLQGTSE